MSAAPGSSGNNFVKFAHSCIRTPLDPSSKAPMPLYERKARDAAEEDVGTDEDIETEEDIPHDDDEDSGESEEVESEGEVYEDWRDGPLPELQELSADDDEEHVEAADEIEEGPYEAEQYRACTCGNGEEEDQVDEFYERLVKLKRENEERLGHLEEQFVNEKSHHVGIKSSPKIGLQEATIEQVENGHEETADVEQEAVIAARRSLSSHFFPDCHCHCQHPRLGDCAYYSGDGMDFMEQCPPPPPRVWSRPGSSPPLFGRRQEGVETDSEDEEYNLAAVAEMNSNRQSRPERDERTGEKRRRAKSATGSKPRATIMEPFKMTLRY